MEAKIIISDELIEKIMTYTHSSSINEAVNVVLKDWMLFHRMREMSKKIANNPMHLNGRQSVREIRMNRKI